MDRKCTCGGTLVCIRCDDSGERLTLKQQRFVEATLDPDVKTRKKASELAGYTVPATGSRALSTVSVASAVATGKARQRGKARGLMRNTLAHLADKVGPGASVDELARIATVAGSVLKDLPDEDDGTLVSISDAEALLSLRRRRRTVLRMLRFGLDQPNRAAALAELLEARLEG